MTRPASAINAQPDKKNGHKPPEPAPALELAQEFAPPAAALAGPLGAAGDGTLASQAARLGDAHMHAVQRQTLAAQIGQVQGNQHLQQVVQRQAAERAGAAALIVEDEAPNLQPGQMRKAEFLAQLQAAVCAAADEALVGSPYSALGCPYIASVFSRLPGRPATYIERGIRLYAPEAAGATTAAGYFLPIANRVRTGITHWRETGEVTGVPASLASLAEGAPAEAAGGGAVQRQADRAQPGGAALAWVQMQSSDGRPLESGTRQRMESGLGQSLGGVTLHTDTRAAQMAEAQDARAFTVGQDVFFGAGEYRPGTPIGDALIAHELAHVAQQKVSKNDHELMRLGGGEVSALEKNADLKAGQAIGSMLGLDRPSMSRLGLEPVPTMQTGLRLQRCSSKEEDSVAPELVTGAGLGEVVTYNGKTLVKMGGDAFYISGKPPAGTWTPKSGTTSVLFIYRKSKPGKMYRLDYDRIKFGPQAGKMGWEHNQNGVARILKLNVTNHQPAGGWGKVSGTGIRIYKHAGKALFVAGLMMSGIEIYYAENKAKAVAKTAGGLAGAAAGAKGGAWVGGNIGKFFGPWGAAIGAGLGGLIGGAAGAWGGSEAAETIYELVAEELNEEDDWVVLTEDQVETTSGAVGSGSSGEE